MWEFLRHDLHFAFRMLGKNPGFAAAAVLTLALGIGANTAIFTVANAVLLRPLPYAEPDRLELIAGERPDQNSGTLPFSWPRFSLMKEHNRSFSGIAAFTFEVFNLTGHGDPEQLASARVSANFFDVLGVRPSLGRGFRSEEDRPGGPPVALISHSLWTRAFGASASVLGQSITLDSKDYAIVGVLPPGFQFSLLGANVDVWAPKVFELNLATPDQVRGGAGFLNAVARLKPGVSPAQAQAEMDVLNRRYQQENPKFPDADPRQEIRAANLRDQLVSNVRPALLILFGAVGVVLLIACANVASLLLSRSLRRKKEMAVRSALGATRGGLARQLLTESLLLSGISGILGILLSQWGTRALAALGKGNLPRAEEISTDGAVLGFTLLVSLLTGIAFGLMPSLHGAAPDLASALREESRGTTGGRRGNLARQLLVAGEVALCTVLLIGAGLLIRSFVHLLHVSPGCDPKNVLTMNVTLPPAKYPKPKAMADFADRLVAEIATIPGVRAAAVASALPVNPTRFAPTLLEGQPVVPVGQRPVVGLQTFTPGYLDAMRVPLLRGRAFTAHDNNPQAPVALVNQAIVKRYWPTTDPIGKHVILGRQLISTEVVGVIGDVKNISLASDPQPEVFVPFAQLPWAALNLIVRTDSDPSGFVGAIRHRVASIDKDQPVTAVRTLDEVLGAARTQQRFTMALLGIFAATALLLATVGLYGVIAYSVAQRTQELGIRMALGASRTHVLGMVMRQGLLLTFSGLALGLVASLVVTRLISSQLFLVSATDPLTFLGCAVLFTGIAMAATYLPAHRATRVDPCLALRHE